MEQCEHHEPLFSGRDALFKTPLLQFSTCVAPVCLEFLFQGVFCVLSQYVGTLQNPV
jgi:hypothetical protein